MKIKGWVTKSESIGVALLYFFIIGAFIAFLFGFFTFISYTFPTSVLNPESNPGAIVSYGAMIFGGIGISSGLLSALIFLTLSIVNPLTQKEIQNLRSNVAYHKSQINSLRSDEWNCIVKKSLGDKFNRITSQQFLLDERDNLIRYHQQFLDNAERQLDNTKV